jgi:hypothetical protein
VARSHLARHAGADRRTHRRALRGRRSQRRFGWLHSRGRVASALDRLFPGNWCGLGECICSLR